MRIKVTPEGRDGVWLADKDSVVDFLRNYESDQIHNFIQAGGAFIGIDMSKATVIKEVKASDRLGLLTGKALAENMRHALSVITGNKLLMFDIGDITEKNLLVT